MKSASSYRLSKKATLFLRIALPLLVLSSLTFLLFYLEEHHRAPIYAKHFYRPLIEYPLSGLTITAAGALFIDYIEKHTT